MALHARHSSLADLQARGEHVAHLLRERRLDRTLTTALPSLPGPDRVAPFGVEALDHQLHGGLPRGQVSELVGPASSGRTSLAWAWLGAATRRGESVALIDTFDRCDPRTAEACGIVLSRLLWVRGQAITKTASALDPTWLPGARAVEGPGTLLERTIDRSLKALNLVLQSGVCSVVVMDLIDVPAAGIRRIPHTTWLRLQRIVEGTDIACLLLGALPLARSAGGVTLTTGGGAPSAEHPPSLLPELRRASPRAGHQAPQYSSTAQSSTVKHPSTEHRAPSTMNALWSGRHDRSRRLAGLEVGVRLSSPRRTVQGTAALATVTRHDAWAVE